MPAGFLDTRFPEWVSFGSSGGPSYRTTVIEVKSGHEQRNQEWQYPRHIFNVGYGARRLDAMGELIRFFNAARGRTFGFRYKDPVDYNSINDVPVTGGTISDTDQYLKDGDGAQTEFQVVKNYTVGADTQVRIITRLVSGTLVVAVDGTPVVPSSIDLDQGTFVLAAAPGVGEAVTVGYEFDIPVRFETDVLDVAYESHDNLDSNIKVVELREGPYATL